MFVTITTVGYGDFSCETALGRCTIVFIMLSGILYIANKSDQLLQLVRKVRYGEGSFANRMRRPFILILGSAKSMSLLKALIRQLDRHADDRTDAKMSILLLHDDDVFSKEMWDWSRTIDSKLRCFHVRYLKGSPFSRHDMVRRLHVESPNLKGVFVIDDLERSLGDDSADKKILLSCALRRFVPERVPVFALVRRFRDKQTLLASNPSKNTFIMVRKRMLHSYRAVLLCVEYIVSRVN